MIRPAGIDIGASSIKLIELQEKKGKIELLNCAENPVSGNDIKTSLRDLLAISKITSKQVNVSLSGPSVIVRYIEMPAMKKEELRSAIKFEGEKYMPFNVNEAIMDCAVLNKSISGNATRVLLVAAREDRVKEYIETFKELGLDISAIDVDSVAMLNAFQRLDLEAKQESAYAMINIGARFSNINIVAKGYPYFTRDVIWGGMDVTNRIKESLGLNAVEAEALKRDPGGRKADAGAAVAPALEKFISEIRMSFDYFETQFGKAVDRVYLSGGTAYLFNIVDFLKDNLGIDALLWNPFDGIDMPEGPVDKELRNSPARFAVAMGLALRK